MPDESLTITLPASDWPILLSALYEAAMPMKISAPVANRLQIAIAEAQAPKAEEPIAVTPIRGSKS